MPRSSRGFRSSKYRPSDQAADRFLFTFAQVVEVLCDELFGTGRPIPQQGLLIVAGATGSGKSQITRGLIYEYLRRTYKRSGCQHLLTYEDPIEVPFFRAAKLPLGIDYKKGKDQRLIQTARELGVDVRNLRQAIKDALRQTPTVFYIGEVRSSKQWPLILDFAATGHFVVATTHAGSLSELLSKLLHEAAAETPAQRGYYSGRLSGLIHLRSFSIANGKSGIVPSLWRRTGDAVPRLINDYLGSLLATDYSAAAAREYDRHYLLGRTYFARRLVLDAFRDEEERGKLLKKLIPKATLADLKGE